MMERILACKERSRFMKLVYCCCYYY